MCGKITSVRMQEQKSKI